MRQWILNLHQVFGLREKSIMDGCMLDLAALTVVCILEVSITVGSYGHPVQSKSDQCPL